MTKDEIKELGYQWVEEKEKWAYYDEEDNSVMYLNKAEIEALEEPFEVVLSKSIEDAWKYRYLTGVKPLLIYHLVEYHINRIKVKKDAEDFLFDGEDFIPMLNNEFSRKEFIESVEVLDKYDLIDLEWLDKDKLDCKIKIKNPPMMKDNEELEEKSKKRMKECYNEIGKFEKLPAKDFIL